MKDLKDPMNFGRAAHDTIRKLAELSLHALHVLHGRPAVGFFSTDGRSILARLGYRAKITFSKAA